MEDWDYAPDYRFYISSGATGLTHSLRTLQQLQALLVTTEGIGQLTVTFSDTDGLIRRSVAPRAMDIVQLWLLNRFGRWGLAWTGVVDEFHRTFDPHAGDLVQILATSPQKYFEITRQTATDVQRVAQSFTQNVRASDVLRYAATQCRFPASMLQIDPNADVGSGLQSLNGAVLLSPDQQPWTHPLQQLQANAATEWFFSEDGTSFWRQVNFVSPWGGAQTGVITRPTTIPTASIIQADYWESDKGVVTSVEVRYYGNKGYTGPTAGQWSAPSSMVSHLRERHLVTYASWVMNQAAAEYLAYVLGQQLSSGVAQATVTTSADASTKLGTLVTVPALGIDGNTTYYVSSITHQLHWGGQWTTTYGLSFGRDPRQSFPYVGQVYVPQLTDAAKQGLSPLGVSTEFPALFPDSDSWVSTHYSLITNRALSAQQIAMAQIAPGAEVQLWSGARSTGKNLGSYTTVVPAVGQKAGTLGLSKPPAAEGWVTIVSQPPVPSGDSGLPAGSGLAGGNYTGPVALGTPGLGSLLIPIAGDTLSGSVTQPYGPTSFAGEPSYAGYAHFHLGIDLVASEGTPILSCCDGVVTSEGSSAVLRGIGATWGFGNALVVSKGDMDVLYGHCSSWAVSVGDQVKRGQVIAYVGHTGNVSPSGPAGAHLHLTVVVKGSWTDPAPYLGSS